MSDSKKVNKGLLEVMKNEKEAKEREEQKEWTPEQKERYREARGEWG